MANLSASFLQRKNQILGIKTNAKTPSVSSSTKSTLSTGFLERKKQILTPKPVATTQPIEPLKSSALTLPTTPISGNMGVGSNQIAYPKQATATPEQNRVAMKAIDIVKNTRNAINDGIAVAGTPLKIFFPTPVYAPEDYEDAKKMASEYEKSANLKVNKVANQFSSGLYTGMTGGIIKPSVGEAKTIPEKVASGTGALLGTYYTMVKIGAFADKVLFPGKAIETTLKLSPTVAKYVVPIVKNVATFDIYGQLDPDTQDRAKKMFMDTVTAIPFTLLGNIQKGIYKVPATFALGYSMAKAAGASTEDALINGSLLALLAATEALTSPRTKNLNTRQLTPEEIRAEVFRQNKQNTQQGKDLLQIANQAEQTGSKAELQVNQVKSSILEDILGKKTSITQVKVDYVKNPDIIGGKENVSAPATPETQVAPKGIIPPIIPQQPPVIPPKEVVTSPQPPETTKKTKPVEKAVEKPTAESLIKEKGYEPASVDIKDNENFIVENLDGKPAKLMEIPLSEFGKPKFETGTNYKYEPGRKITSPIEVTIWEGKLKITDGANRFEQAYNNKDKTILAVVENYEQYKPVEEKAQKTEKQPVEKPVTTKSAAEQENLPYTERTYYRGLQGKAAEEYQKTGILPKAKQAFGGEYSITSDYETAKQYAGEKGIVVEIKIDKNAGVSEADPFDKRSLRDNWNDLQDIGEGEMIVNNSKVIKVVNKPKVAEKKKVTSPKAVEQTKKEGVVETPTPSIKTGTPEQAKNEFLNTMETQLRRSGMENEISTYKDGKFEYKTIDSSKLTGEEIDNPQLVKEYENKIKAGERPKVLVRQQAGDLWISDGNHKLRAYKNLGIKDIPVIEVNLDSPIKTGGDEKQAQKPKELTLAPSKATSEKKLLKEVAKADVAQHFNFNKGTYNKPAITKNDIKIFLSDKDFAANPVFTVVKTKELLPSGDNLTVLEYKSPKLEITLDPRGLQINPEKLKPGTKIRVDIEAIKKYPGVSQTRIYNQGKVFASTGAFADIKNLTEKFETKSTPEMRIVEMPEMVRLATQLMEGVPEIKRSRARKNLGVPNGLFRGDGKGKIYLNPDIFKTPGQAAKTLAHEMGHLADYLPDHTLSRGNVIGRVATLNKFLRSTFSGHLTEQKVDELMRQRNDLREQRKELKDENGVVSDRAIDNRILTELKKVNTEIKKLRSGESISDPKIRKELKRLSRKWKPFDPKQNLEFTKYRYSPPELYADALSVLFNDPLLLETKAPKFYEAFFKYLDQKPEYKKELLDLQTTLLAGDDQVMNLRLTEIAKNYKEGNAAWLAKHAEKQNNFFNIMGELNTNFVNKDYNLTKKVNEAVKQGKSVDPEINPIFTQGGLNYLDGEVKNVIVDSYQKVHTYTSKIPQISITTDISGKTETLSLNGWESLGMITQLERSMFERGKLANPGGYDPKTAKETLAVLKSKYETKDWKKLQKAKRLFRKGTMTINKMALEHGFRTPELSAELMANKTYATFQVLDYIDTYISPAIYKQTGTLKAVANPATATVMKSVATVRAILYNDAKNANLDFLTQVDPENVVPAKTRFNGKYKEPIESRDPDKVLVKSVRDGKVVGVYVDKDLNLIFNHTTETTLRSLGKLSKLLTGAGLYRPIFTSINLGFQLFNFQKDFIRTWRNMPDRTLGDIVLSLPRLIKDYATSVPTAWRAATGKPDDLIKEMENANIIGLTRNDVYGSPDIIGEEYISKVLQDLGAMPELKQSTIRTIPGIKYIPKLFDAVSLFGNFIERLPKVAGYKRLRGKVVTGEFSKPELAHYVRNYIGSPDFLNVGRVTPVSNNLFLFSNAAKEGIRGDINMAFRPKTKGGWWFKTLIGTVLPKLLQLAASLGLLGLLYKKMLDGVSEYDKTNYTIIPLGLDKNGKTIYIRLPNDESGRFMGAMVWKIGNIFDKERHQDLVSSLMDVFSLYSGQLPSMTPSITGGSALLTYLSGRNPYDSFRNRLIIPDTTFKAGFKYSFPVMLEWLKNNQGLTIVMPSYTPDGEMTNLEKILNLPVLSNVIGRFIKVSDYGKIEKASQIQKEVSKEASIKTLDKREKTNTALEKYLAGEKTDENYKDIAGQLVKDVLGHNPDMNNKEEVSQAKAIEKQFRFAVIAGSNPPEISNVVDATTNQAKAENLKILQETVPIEKFAELLKMFVEEGVVTVDTLIKYGEIMSKEQSAVPEKKKTALNLVKPAYAIEDKTITPTPAGKKTTYAMTNADGEQISVTPRNNKITEKVLRDNQELVDIIVKAASDFDIDPGLMLDMAYSESTFRANPPLNDNSPTQVVKGLFQWKESSWEMAKKALNDQIGDDRTDAKDNAIATAWALSTGKIRWWEANGNHLKWSKNYTTKELKKYGWRL